MRFLANAIAAPWLYGWFLSAIPGHGSPISTAWLLLFRGCTMELIFFNLCIKNEPKQKYTPCGLLRCFTVLLEWFLLLTIYHLVMTKSLPWKNPPIFKNGEPSISMGHLYHGYVTNTQRVEATAPVDAEIVGTAAQSPQLVVPMRTGEEALRPKTYVGFPGKTIEKPVVFKIWKHPSRSMSERVCIYYIYIYI